MRLALLAVLLAPLPCLAEGEEGESPPPAEESSPAPQGLEGLHLGLEQMGRRLNWGGLSFQEDDCLVVAGTVEPKALEEAYAHCRKALDRFCGILGTPPGELRGVEKFHYVILAKKAEFMEFVREESERREIPAMLTLHETVSNLGSFLCVDPVYAASLEGRPSLIIHSFAHQLLKRYAALKGGKEAVVPGWIFEGLAAYLDGDCLQAAPASCCVAKVGYMGDKFDKRRPGGAWEAVVQKVVKEHQACKQKEKSPLTRLANLAGVKFDKLSGTEVAVSWHLVRELAGKQPEKFKAFLDPVLEGGKQAEAFKGAFGKSLDDYEKAWIAGVLRDSSRK